MYRFDVVTTEFFHRPLERIDRVNRCGEMPASLSKILKLQDMLSFAEWHAQSLTSETVGVYQTIL